MVILKYTEVVEPLPKATGTTIVLILSHFQLPSLSHHTQPGPELQQVLVRQSFGSGCSSFSSPYLCSLALHRV